MINSLRAFWLWPLASGMVLAASLVHPPWTVRAMQLTGDFCSHTLYVWFMVIAALLLLWRGISRDKCYFWWVGLVSLLTPLCVEGLKRATRLPRPDGDPSGFPSGHTTFSFALAWLLMQTYPRAAPVWFGIAVAIGWSRVEGHAHFPYQVLCGACLGTAVGWLISHKIARPPSGAMFAPVTNPAREEA